LNPVWEENWGGAIELWDKEVTRCHHAFAPLLNRCVIFETSDISYHGVQPVKCPPDIQRKSFAAYYYTKEAPAHWKGEVFSTIFQARPNEVIRGKVLMPLERVERRVRQKLEAVQHRVNRILGKKS
jgi:hypothetical protein